MSRPDLLPTVSPQKEYQPEKWTARHRMIARLSAVGYRNNEIAEMLDMSPSRVSIILGDQRAQIDIQDAVESVADNVIDLHDRLKAHATEALDEIMYLLRNSKDEKLRKSTAFGILDRAGYTPVKKHMNVAPELPADVATRVERAISDVQETTVEADYEIIDEHETEERESE